MNNNGLGILTKCTSAIVKEEINGQFNLEIKYPIKAYLSNEIETGRIIVCEVGYGNRQAFRIYKIDKTLDEITIYANHIFYDLIDNILEDVYPKNLDANQFINWILNNTQYPNKFIGNGNISNIATARYIRKNVVESILGNEENSIIKLFSAEIERDNYNISVLKRRGTDRGLSIRYAKNINGISFSEDNSTVATRIMPKGYDGMLLPEKYIDSPIINNYSHPIIKVIEYNDIKLKSDNSQEDEGFETIEECYKEMRKRVDKEFKNGIDKISINAEVDFIELTKTTEYKNYSDLEKAYIGDTVNIYLETLNIDIKERVISTVYDVLLDRFTNIEIGALSANYISNNAQFKSNIEKEILPNILENAKESATKQIIQALGGNVYKTQSELFIMDSDNINTAKKVWRWNLNGLGYSSTGINGPYELAMTQDGNIVADFIKTGTMSVSRIEGLANIISEYQKQIAEININIDGIKQSVNNTINYKRTAEGITEVHLTEAGAVEILDLEVRGNKTYKNYLYPSNNLYLGNIYTNMPGFNYEEGADNSEIYNNS